MNTRSIEIIDLLEKFVGHTKGFSDSDSLRERSIVPVYFNLTTSDYKDLYKSKVARDLPEGYTLRLLISQNGDTGITLVDTLHRRICDVLNSNGYSFDYDSCLCLVGDMSEGYVVDIFADSHNTKDETIKSFMVLLDLKDYDEVEDYLYGYGGNNKKTEIYRRFKNDRQSMIKYAMDSKFTKSILSKNMCIHPTDWERFVNSII